MADDKLNWVFDSLVEFLKGPVWNIPILTFIEQKSVVFEPGTENEKEFMKIHNHYKNLVDFMLGSYMEDIQITPNQFEMACAVASKKSLTQFHQNLFEQVWAADDFEIFRRMMTQKNLELQLQALEVLAQKYGITPEFAELGGNEQVQSSEEKILKEIIRQSLEQESEPNENQKYEEKEAAIAALAEKDRLVNERQKEKDMMDRAIKLSINDGKCPETSQTPPAPAPSPIATNRSIIVPLSDNAPHAVGECISPSSECPTTEARQEESQDATEEITIPKLLLPETENDVSLTLEQPNNSEILTPEVEGKLQASDKDQEPMERPTIGSLSPISVKNTLDDHQSHGTAKPWSDTDQDVLPQNQVLPIDMEKRQNYLRQQRDRLLAMKKQERAKNLKSYEEQLTEKRPKSAKAARRILAEQKHDCMDPQTLEFRKTLASRLRSEVIDMPL